MRAIHSRFQNENQFQFRVFTSISWEKVTSAPYFAHKHCFLKLFLNHPCFSSFLEKYFKLKYLLLQMTCHNWFVEISNQNPITQKECTLIFFIHETHFANLIHWIQQMHIVQNCTTDNCMKYITILKMIYYCFQNTINICWEKVIHFNQFSWINCITQ